MDSQPRTLRSAFLEAESRRRDLESSWESSSATFQDNLAAAIALYEESLKAAREVALFSPNETLEDVNSGDLQYMLINYHLAELSTKITGGDRKAHILHARRYYEAFLKLLDSYDMLSKSDSKLYGQYTEAPDMFSTASRTDAAARRETKIARFKEEKALKSKLEHLRQNPQALENDEDALRDLHLTSISLSIYQTFQSLESIAQELHILAMAPPSQPEGASPRGSDTRERESADKSGYSDRLDSRVGGLAGLQGPILSKDGRPLRPFTILDNRTRFQQGVFRPDHSLPTMTIDEYLEEEKKRGGIIEGGGEQSGVRPEPDEDNMTKADEETLKAREWDEFTEANPKGSGNTFNRG
ncbi:phosphatase 2A-associated protein [Trichodelitschia bisporula]|uniref:Phosphatase 2A-associated protein n=1 Tax=Trichodelitschia bisporula TaxID=703511 RepID=A0A6G1HKN3_9PEZI|nr:phosphatase 2A-associated protein [Trichodelitschia bisporula]